MPFMAKLVVYAKRIEPLEARLRVFCITDDREERTLEAQQHFVQVAKSRDVEVIEGKTQYVELAGNLIPVTKSGEQLHFAFKAFRENRLPFNVRVKDQHADIVGRALFMREPRVAKGEQPQQPICILNIVLPEQCAADELPPLRVRVTYSSIVPPSTTAAAAAALASRDTITTTTTAITAQKTSSRISSSTESLYYMREFRIADIANLVGEDWQRLAPELDISAAETERIRAEHPASQAKQAQAMLRLYQSRETEENCLPRLEAALECIERANVLRELKRTTMVATTTTSSTESAASKRELIDFELNELERMKDAESVVQKARKGEWTANQIECKV